MKDFQTMVRLLAAIRAGEGKPFNTALVDERVLKTYDAERDALACKLQREGYIDGLYIIETLDEGPDTVLWEQSRPEVTIKGLELMQNSEPLRKAAEELKNAAVQTAAAMVAGKIAQM